MKKRIFFVLLMAVTLVSCDLDQIADNVHRYFSQYTYLAIGVQNGVEQAYFDTTAHFNGVWLMTKGPLAGDSLYISHPTDKDFTLVSRSAQSAISLTAELQGSEEWSNDHASVVDYTLLLNGSGTYRIAQDSLFTYELNGIGGMWRYYRALSEGESDHMVFVYTDGGEITLSVQAGDKTQTYHYELEQGRIRCRETNLVVLSYGD